MTRRCLGWTEPRHAPIILGEVAPYDDHRYTDGICDQCMAATHDATAIVMMPSSEVAVFVVLGMAWFYFLCHIASWLFGGAQVVAL